MPPHPLAALTTTPPRDLLRLDAGIRTLRRLADDLAAARVVARVPAGDDVAALGALFDAALASGLACIVLDYVAEVCGDPLVTSSDPTEAYLADGACVEAWCRTALDRARRELEAAAGIENCEAAARALAPVATRVGGLVAIAASLHRGSASSDATAADLHADALRLARAASILDWATTDARTDGGRTDAEWRADVARRRASVRGTEHTLFLDRLARDAGVDMEYPPSLPLGGALLPIFLTGAADAAAADAKLDLAAATLADAGVPPPCLAALGARINAPAARVARWRLAALVDAATAGGAAGAAALDTAVDIVPLAAAPDTPWQLGAALTAAGRPGAALTLRRARAPSATHCLAEAVACLDARLQCGLLTEAYLEARQAAAAASPSDRGETVTTLTTALARWAARERALASVSGLPLSEAEEGAYLAWLASPAGVSAGGTAHAVLYHLMRGRTAAAAVAASAGLDASTPIGARAADLLRMAARDAPAAVRAAVLLPPGEQAGVTVGAAGALPPRNGVALAAAAGVDAPRARLLVTAGPDGRLPLLAPLTGGGGSGGGGGAALEGMELGEDDDVAAAPPPQQQPPQPTTTRRFTAPSSVPFSKAPPARGAPGGAFLTPAGGGGTRAQSKRAKLAAPRW